MAYSKLAVMYGNQQQHLKSLEMAKKAYELRDRASEREKLYIAAYYAHAQGDYPGTLQAWKLYVQNYPRETSGHVNLGVSYENNGDMEPALAEQLQATQLDPLLAVAYSNAAFDFMALGKFEEANTILDQAYSHKLNGFFLHLHSYWLAIARKDSAQMEKEAEQLKSTAPGKLGLTRVMIGQLAGSGQIKSARELSRSVEQNERELGRSEDAENEGIDQLTGECEFGLKNEAQAQVLAALPSIKNISARLKAALVLARCGDVKRARQVADEVLRQYATDTSLNLVLAPQVFAAIDLRSGNAKAAIEELDKAGSYGRYDFGVHLMRAFSYLAGHDPAKALQETQWPLTQKQYSLYPPYKLAQVISARAYAAEGDNTKAREMYQDVLAAWKNADAGLPLVEELKAEYAKLQ